MKYNTTYLPKLSLKKTLKILAIYKKKLIDKLNQKFSLIEVDLPLFDEENSDTLVFLDQITRNVSFDFGSEYKVGSLFLTHSNWMRKMIKRLNFLANEGVIGQGGYVWRDLEENPVKASIKNEIILQVVIDQKTNYVEYVQKTTQDIYDLFLEFSLEVKKDYGIKNSYPQIPKFFSSKFLETQMPNYSFKEREIEIIQNHEAFIFVSPGEHMYSGQIHTYLPSFVYDLKNQYQIILKDKINNEVLKVATISSLTSGQQMNDQLKMYSQEMYLEKPFYAKLAQDEQKILEIKINFPRLMMALLQKGHIGEVQSNVISKEGKIILNKYKVEMI